MVQLKKEMAAPKGNKKGTAKKGTPAKSPKDVEMKAKDKKKFKNENTSKKFITWVEGDTINEDNLEALPSTLENNEKKKSPQKVMEEVESQEEEMETVSEAPKSNKKKNKNSPQKVKEENDSQDSSNTDSKKYNFVAHVRGLDFNSSKLDVQKYFSRYGKMNVHLSRNKHNKALANGGYGFIFFKEEKDMKAAINSENELNGRKLTVTVSIAKNDKRKRELDDDYTRPSKKMASCPGTSIFVGRLNPITTEETLKYYFSKYGEIEDLTVLGKPGNSKGYGFLTFSDDSAMEKALADTHNIDGRDIICQKKTSATPNKVAKNENKKELKVRSEYEIIVRDLPKMLTRDEFKESFSKFGEIKGVTLTLAKKNDPTAGVRSFGFIAFETAESMEKALAAAETMTVLGMPVKIARAKVQVPSEVANTENKRELKVKRDYEIMVRNLPKMLTRNEFKESFSKFGEIEWVTLPLSKKNDPSAGVKGFGFIAFKTAESLEEALAAAKTMQVHGKNVKVSNAKSGKKDEPSQKKEPKVESSEKEGHKQENDHDNEQETDDDKQETDDDEHEEEESDESGDEDSESE